MKKMMVLVILVFMFLNMACQSSLGMKHNNKIIIKDENNIFLNGQPVSMADLAAKLAKPADKAEDKPILISIDNPKLPIKSFISLLEAIISAHRQDLCLRASGDDSVIHYLYIPKSICGKEPETGQELHGAAWFSRDLQGNLLHPPKPVLSTLIIPSMPLNESESCFFEGKQVFSYSDIIKLMKDNKLFPDGVSLVYAWRESSAINDFITFLSEVKSNGVRFVEIRGTQLDVLDKYELKIETAGE